MTARIAVDFKRPVLVGRPLRADGWVTRARRRIVDTEGRLIDTETGATLATATGVYLAADESRKQELRARYQRPSRTATPEHGDRE
jgi:acyl-CoA thioesterase FadM